jgi:hypothetical protein
MFVLFIVFDLRLILLRGSAYSSLTKIERKYMLKEFANDDTNVQGINHRYKYTSGCDILVHIICDIVYFYVTMNWFCQFWIISSIYIMPVT